ncbi:MAG: hypothetical protein M0R46_04865 [Candidatus Muirbacterium halophilum]|nr:hypothetical protein [Candidatus Muirbacterium halophilum]MCK9475227.1 hypothetical protein [Candidatus Muirbacterium halophilum]
MSIIFKNVILKHYLVEDVNIKLNKEFQKQYENLEDDIKIKWKIVEDEKNNVFFFNFEVNINKNKKNFEKRPYKIVLNSIGVFEIKGFENNESQYILIAVNIMIGLIRNYIMNVTGKFPLGEFILPAIDLNEIKKFYLV